MKTYNFPKQQLPFKSKGTKWRKQCVDWADNKTFLGSELVRKTVTHKKVNYDLLNGKIHMQDLQLFVNPDNQNASFIPDKIPHYPIMNSKLRVLQGEESSRAFDFRVVVTNPNAISEIEETKKKQIFSQLQQMIANTAQSEEEFNEALQGLSDYYTYEYQDFREVRANSLLNHYIKELNIPKLFNDGFTDAMAVGEEIYQCDIVGGEPTIERLNPCKVRIFRSGYSNKIEDADIIILEDYWSPGRVIDYYHDVLSPKDVKYLEDLPNSTGKAGSAYGEWDERYTIKGITQVDDVFNDNVINSLFSIAEQSSLLPYDFEGNVRVLRVYWKSKRKIKKVKRYDPITGEPNYELFPEDYILNTSMGEEEEIFWVNQAWEGTKIGEEIYVNMRPMPVQFNSISNPSRCHFGIVGSVYNLNDDKPFSMVDMMKQYNYLYDAVHDKLNKMVHRNWGKIITMDFAKIPAGWDAEKWMYYARTNGIAVIDSFKEGNKGAATGKLAGGLNNASSGVIDAEFGNSIVAQLQLLQSIKDEMSEVAGISRQREGQISNRETVGGVERATLQSSHITEWLFITHEDVKKRALETFLEYCKIALRGRNKKFQYILPDHSMQIINIEGDEFAECDYGLVVSNDSQTQQLKQSIETLAQAALQNQTLSFSTIMDLYSSSSIAEKKRLIERDEKRRMEREQQAQQQQLQAQQQQAQVLQQTEMAKMEQENLLNERDNETKIVVATINAQSRQIDNANEKQNSEISEESRAKLDEQIREFNARLSLDKERLEFDKQKASTDVRLKEKQINSRPKSTNK